MSEITLTETLVPVTTQEADQQATLEYAAELQAGLSDMLYALSSSRVRAANIDVREVGALRMAAYSARFPVFEHLGETDEAENLRAWLLSRMQYDSLPTMDTVAAVQRIISAYPERAHSALKTASISGDETPAGRLGINMAVARGTVHRALEEAAGLPDDAVAGFLTAVQGRGDGIAPNVAEQRQQLTAYLHDIGQQLDLDVDSLSVIANCGQWLEPPVFDPAHGWVGGKQPPEGYLAAYDAVKQRAAAKLALERAQMEAVAAAEAAADAAPLPVDPGDWLAIIGNASRNGWKPSGSLPRYTSEGREYLSLEPYAVDARRYLRHMQANQAAA